MFNFSLGSLVTPSRNSNVLPPSTPSADNEMAMRMEETRLREEEERIRLEQEKQILLQEEQMRLKQEEEMRMQQERNRSLGRGIIRVFHYSRICE